MKVKLANLGTTRKVPTPPGAEVKATGTKAVTDYPSMSLNARVIGLKDAKVGQKVTLTLEAEVTGLDKASQWEIDEGRAKEGDVRVSLEVKKGAVVDPGE